MNEQQFAARRASAWTELEAMLLRPLTPEDAAVLPRLYRAICHDLAVARHLQFNVAMVERLNRLVLRGHHRLYQARAGMMHRVLAFFAHDFRRAVHAEKRAILWAGALFYGLGAAVALWLWRDPDGVFVILDPATVRSIEAMYDPQGKHFLRPRSFDSDTAMFGFYIYNNISIGFRTFAGGVFVGLGALAVLVFNGVFLGAVVAHLVNQGSGEVLLQFVIGHGSLELNALVFCGAAGLRLGGALIAPGPWSRAVALRLAAHNALPLVYGSTAMLFVAAAIEAYWSSAASIDPGLKIAIGSVGWAAVALYFLIGGRRGGS